MELRNPGFQVSASTIRRMLSELGYSLQGNRKTRERKQHPDRDAQFEHINARVKARKRRGEPALSVDTKKKETLGNKSNVGQQVTLQLQGLPNRSEPAARFTQTFALSRQRLAVTVAQLTRADQAGITRQSVCPVMGTRLGDHGAPVKLLVGETPIYVCCKGCIAKVQHNAEQYVANVIRASRR